MILDTFGPRTLAPVIGQKNREKWFRTHSVLDAFTQEPPHFGHRRSLLHTEDQTTGDRGGGNLFLRKKVPVTPGPPQASPQACLLGPAFEVYLRSSNLVELQQELAAARPSIVFLQTGALGYWNTAIFHTLVLIGLDRTTVILQDPYFTRPIQATSVQTFEKAWAQTSQFTAFIRPRKSRVVPNGEEGKELA
jgi:hypothetical protein